MSSRLTYFVDVVLPLAVPKLYTYRVPHELNEEVLVGKRVIVQLGRTKLYAAIIHAVHETPPSNYQAKYINSILDKKPVVNEKQLQLWRWISDYYICHIGEVMSAALPEALRLASETKIVLNPAFNVTSDLSNYSEKEHLLIEALELQNTLTIKDTSEIVEQKTVYPIIKALIEKGVVLIMEEVKQRFKPKVETFVQLSDHMKEEEALKTLFDNLEKRAPKQLEVLMAYMKLADGNEKFPEISKLQIAKHIENYEAPLKALIKKEVFVTSQHEVGRLDNANYSERQFELNSTQQGVISEIKQQFYTDEKNVSLIHGVTSSGKTEIYIKLISDAIKQNKQALYLVPEIALTTQIINRLRAVFGNKVGVYHSKFSSNERVEVWNNVLSTSYNKLENSKRKVDDYQLIIGARSSLFLPFNNLGLIIVDEEHDSSYKQYDPAPRYNARDTAIYLGRIHGAKVLLGSATPSIESYYNAQEGKYGFTQIQERFGGIQMPDIIIADVKEAKQKKQMKSHFTPQLLEHIEAALKNKQQVILFQNRRGFAPRLECTICAWTPQCKNCDVSLTYHKTGNICRCHYCGYTTPPPTSCSACGNTQINMQGFGTEKIEEELSVFFEHANIARMDLDTTRSKFAHQHILQDFENGSIDILVGTQMVTKGLDFSNVTLVGILNADGMLNFPDFRSFERSFQLMAQVAGRAGRRKQRGKVIIQTQSPDHEIIQDVVDNNYLSMYNAQLSDRKEFKYPPYYRLIELRVIDKDVNMVDYAAKQLAERLKVHFQHRVLGPEFPLVSRVKNKYIKHVLLKIERDASSANAKDIILKLISSLKSQKEFKGIRIQLDVDPV